MLTARTPHSRDLDRADIPRMHHSSHSRAQFHSSQHSKALDRADILRIHHGSSHSRDMLDSREVIVPHSREVIMEVLLEWEMMVS